MATVAKSKILIPYSVDGEEFYASTIESALEDCLKEHNPVFMPQLADARIAAGKDDVIWQNWYTTPSLMVTGTTKAGNNVVVFAHVLNYFSNPDNIKVAKERDLRNGAGSVPEDEFQRLLDLEDNVNVFVVDYNTLKRSESDVITLKDALKHPEVVPFFGGRERAEAYLEKHKLVYDTRIGVWHADDLSEKPLARVLFFGGSGDGLGGLGGGNGLYGSARFVGVRAESASEIAARPTLEQVLKVSEDFVPGVAKGEFQKRLQALYE